MTVNYPRTIDNTEIYAFIQPFLLAGGRITAWSEPPHDGGEACASYDQARTLIFMLDKSSQWYGRAPAGHWYIDRFQADGGFGEHPDPDFEVGLDFFPRESDEALAG